MYRHRDQKALPLPPFSPHLLIFLSLHQAIEIGASGFAVRHFKEIKGVITLDPKVTSRRQGRPRGFKTGEAQKPLALFVL